MHAHWPKLICLLLGLVTATGCMTRHINSDPPEISRRQGFKNSNSEAGSQGSSAQSSNHPAAHDSQTSAVANDVNSESNDPSTQASSSSQAPAVPPLGTAHTAQRMTGDGNTYANSVPTDDVQQTTTTDQEQALMEVVAELEALGELDAETKRQLIADLQATKPALWQPMLSIYRLALAKHKRGESLPSTSPPPSQVIASDDDPASGQNSETSLEMPAANTAVASKSAATTHQLRSKPTLEIVTPAEQIATRESPLRPATGAPNNLRSTEPEPSDYEVQPAQYETPVDEYVSESALPLRQRDRGVRLATASSAEKSPLRQASASASIKRDVRDPATASRADELADWQAYLEESILLLEENSDGPARTAEEVRRQAELRLLYLAGGDREAALRPIDGISTTQQEFWSETLFALATWLDAESLPDGPRRAAETRRHLEAAVTRLGELSTLGVRNIAFCSKVNSYGIYETYSEDVFEPGQQVLLYAELENFKCEETPTGFITSVRSSYQIFDARGVRVDTHDFATTEETCRNRRRDFFMRYFIDLPERIYDGEYTLKITIEDMKGQTSGEATIPFTIKEHKQ